MAGHRELAPPSKCGNEGGFKKSVRTSVGFLVLLVMKLPQHIGPEFFYYICRHVHTELRVELRDGIACIAVIPVVGV